MGDEMTQPVSQPRITVNGAARALDGVPAHVTALDWLRDLGLTGAKEGCAEGECGACSVMVVRPAGDGASQWTAINACLVPALALDGQEIVTAEGLGAPDDLHPVQREMAERGGSQCGYCTPGFVCSMAAEFYRRDRVTAGAQNGDPEHGPNGFDLHAMSGNLCRCTGYRPIRDAAFALEAPALEDRLAQRANAEAPRVVPTRTEAFARPGELAEAFALLSDHPDATVIAGCTDWGVEVNLRGERASYAVAVDRLPELRAFETGDETVEIGAALTLSEVETLLAGRVPILGEVFPQFASRLIRNTATIGGNLATASPIGDFAPALLALEASVVLVSAEGDREVQLADFWTGYRETVLRPGELIRSVRFPRRQPTIGAFHKIAKRKYDDISSVAGGLAIDVTDGVVTKARIGLGGIAATPIRALAAEAALEGRPWSETTVQAAAEVLRAEGTPMDDHRASAAYRSAMLGNALLKLGFETGAGAPSSTTGGRW
jgi:xanthine dehydrogenase small subunit